MAALDNLETLPDQFTITAMARLKCDEKISEVLKYLDKRPLSIQIRYSRKLVGDPSISLENEHETNLLS